MRSYPINIYADNKLVYSGNTEKSLGYIFIPLTGVKAQNFTIKLQGDIKEEDAFGQIIEVAAPVANELDLFKAANADKTGNELRIVEIDFLKHL